MNFYVGPAGSPVPDNPADAEGWTELGPAKVTTLTVDITPDTERFVAEIRRVQHALTARFNGTGSRMALYSIFGLPYRHPRQILHNGRKPR